MCRRDMRNSVEHREIAKCWQTALRLDAETDHTTDTWRPCARSRLAIRACSAGQNAFFARSSSSIRAASLKTMWHAKPHHQMFAFPAAASWLDGRVLHRGSMIELCARIHKTCWRLHLAGISSCELFRFLVKFNKVNSGSSPKVLQVLPFSSSC